MFSFRLLDPETAAAAIASDRVILEAQFSSIDHPPRDDRPLHVPGAIAKQSQVHQVGAQRRIVTEG